MRRKRREKKAIEKAATPGWFGREQHAYGLERHSESVVSVETAMCDIPNHKD
jgi:hypothetical protein